MILFVNTFLTPEGAGVSYNRGRLPESDKVDIFKYSLASLAVIPWSHVFIYWQVDESYAGRRSELEGYIRALFPGATTQPTRLDRQRDWQAALQPVLDADDPLVWFNCNHDHIFIDYELDLLLRIEQTLQRMSARHQYVSSYPTHWPELLSFARDARADPRAVTQLLEAHEDYSVFGFRSTDSFQIVNKNVLRYWWFEHDYGDAWVPRSDPTGRASAGVRTPEIRCVVPHRELVRHFDGYSHNQVRIQDCPPLSIPPGFFDDAIRILYCADKPQSAYVTVNPLARAYSATDPTGADIKGVLEDLPLFWRSRITETRIVRQIPRAALLRARNQAVLRTAWGHLSIPVRQLAAALRFEHDDDREREIRRLERWRTTRDLRRSPVTMLRSVKRTVRTIIGPSASERFHLWRVRLLSPTR